MPDGGDPAAVPVLDDEVLSFRIIDHVDQQVTLVRGVYGNFDTAGQRHPEPAQYVVDMVVQHQENAATGTCSQCRDATGEDPRLLVGFGVTECSIAISQRGSRRPVPDRVGEHLLYRPFGEWG
jgi:hypothetical protein